MTFKQLIVSTMFSVVAVLFIISEEDNAAIATLFENNHFVQEPFKKVLLPNDYEMDKTISLNITTMNMSRLLPSDHRNYYFYNGSFTTPNCEEVVSWFVLKEQAMISEDQLDKLR